MVCLDADTQVDPGAISRLVAHFGDPKVAAVAGNIKVGNRLNLVTLWQSIEYITSQNLDRRAFTYLNAVPVVPGALGAWRRSAVEAVGGFHNDDTLAEDMDLSIRILRAGHRVANEPLALAYTEAPQTLAAFPAPALALELRHPTVPVEASPGVGPMRLAGPFGPALAVVLPVWTANSGSSGGYTDRLVHLSWPCSALGARLSFA